MPDVNPAAAEHSVNDGPPAQLHELKIDRDRFEWGQPTISGQQLRELPTPPVGPDRDLYEEVHGGEDKLIDTNSIVVLKEHGETQFFTAPHHVTPGA